MSLNSDEIYHIAPKQSASGLGIKQIIYYRYDDDEYVGTTFGLTCHCFGEVIYKNDTDPLLVCQRCRDLFTDLPVVENKYLRWSSTDYSQTFRWDDTVSNYDNAEGLRSWIYRWTHVDVEITVTTPSPV